jgi:hypothetical protein
MSPGSDEILVEQIQAGGGTLWLEIRKFNNYTRNKSELPDQSIMEQF